MSKRFDHLRERLLQAGVAPRHVRSYLVELNEHFDDLVKAQLATGQGLEEATVRARTLIGDDEKLTQAMLARPGFRSLAARAPWLVFGIAPIFLPFAMIALITLLTVFMGWLGGGMFHRPEAAAPAWFRLLFQASALISTFLVPLLAASILITFAARQRMTLLCPLMGIAVIVIFSMHMQATFPVSGAKGGAIIVTTTLMPMPYVLGGRAFHVQWLIFLAQAALSLLPAFWLLARRNPPISGG